MSDIRTPDDEIERPGYFYPPFEAGKGYQGATYGRRIEDGQVKPGHSPFSVDFNRRTPSGGWLQDQGDPVLAAADGKVGEVDRSEGLVMLDHEGGYRTEYRHMQDIRVKVGDRVERGERIGSIGDVAGSGRSTSAHLHHVHWRDGKRIKMRFLGEPVATSIGDSDTRPPSWDPPAPVYVVGPPPKATWQGAFKAQRAEAVKLQRALEAAQKEARLATAAVAELRAALTTAEAALTECLNRPVADCSVVEAERDAARRAVGDLRAIASAALESVKEAVELLERAADVSAAPAVQP